MTSQTLADRVAVVTGASSGMGRAASGVTLRGGAAELHLSLTTRLFAVTHNVAHVLVDDAEKIYSLMDAASVRIIKGLRDTDYHLRGFVLADPDGNRIDVGQRLSTDRDD